MVPAGSRPAEQRVTSLGEDLADILVGKARWLVNGGLKRVHEARLQVATTPAPRFDRTPSELPPPAPRVGEHTAELLAQAGFDASEIDALRSAGVVAVLTSQASS